MNPFDKIGDKRWHNEQGQLHRTDGPALIWPNGTQRWYIHGKLHRTDGPAIDYGNGDKSYYIHGNRLTETEFNDITQSEEHLNWFLLKIL